MVAERRAALPIIGEDTVIKQHPQLRPLPNLLPNQTEKPLAPLSSIEPPAPPPEPTPWAASAEEWKIWVRKRDDYLNYHDRRIKAEKFATENDLRGTF